MKKEILFNKVVIVGGGLMGASLVGAMRKSMVAKKVQVLVHKEEYVKCLEEEGIEASADIDEIGAGTDLFIIATPISAFVEVFQSIAKYCNGQTIVVDLGSVKEEVCTMAKENLPIIDNYVGCHPIAGSEVSGVGAYVDDLYVGRKLIITSDKGSPAVMKIARMWQDLGMQIFYLGLEEHDLIYGYVSHLVQRISFNFKKQIEAKDLSIDKLRDEIDSDHFKKFTRLCYSSPTMWSDIFKYNDKAISGVQNLFFTHLRSMNNMVMENKFLHIFRDIKRALSLIGDEESDKVNEVSKFKILTQEEIDAFKEQEEHPKIPEDYFYFVLSAAIIAAAFIISSNNQDNFEFSGQGFDDFVQIMKDVSQDDFMLFARHKTDVQLFFQNFLAEFE
jgi:prephenate dehydrogenase